MPDITQDSLAEQEALTPTSSETEHSGPEPISSSGGSSGKSKWVIAGAILAIIAIIGTGATYWYYNLRDNKTSDSKQTTKTLPSEMTVLLTGAKLSGVYPKSTSDVYETRVMSLIYQPLTKVNADGRAVGILAKSWSNPDNTTWLFNLRQDAKFSNGQPVTAADVAFTITQSKANEWPGSERLALVTKAEAVSDTQVKITTDGVNPIMLNDLAMVQIVNQEQFQSKTDTEYAIGSGPYIIKSHSETDGQKYVLQANPNYYDTKPQVTTLNVIATDDENRVKFGLEHQADVILATANIPSSAEMSDIIAQGYAMKSTLSNSTRILGLDQARDQSPYVGGASTNPLKKLAVRQALYKAIDLTDVVKGTGNPGASVATQLAPVSVFGHDSSITQPPTFDLVAAKQLLVDAGYPNGFSLTIDVPSTSADLLTQVTKHWKEIGVTATVNPLSQEVGLPKLQSHDTSAYFISWEYSTYDFANGFGELLDPENPWNFTQYSNAEATDLFNQLSTTIDLTERKDKSQQLQKLLLDQVAFIPIMFEGDSYIVKNTIDFSDPLPTSWKAL